MYVVKMFLSVIENSLVVFQGTDYPDRKITASDGTQIKRKKVPRIIVTPNDEKLYESVPQSQRKYKLYYRGNYYAAIDDYIDNHLVIEEYNAKKKMTRVEGKKGKE